MSEVAPLLMRETAGVLSPPVMMVQCVVGKIVAMMSRWLTIPACSRSLFVMVPLGFSEETSRLWIS